MKLSVPVLVALNILATGVIVECFQPVNPINARLHKIVTGTGTSNQISILKVHGKSDATANATTEPYSKRKIIRDKVSKMAKRMVPTVNKPNIPDTPIPDPSAIASILTASTRSAVDLAREGVRGRLNQNNLDIPDYDDILETEAAMECESAIALDTIALAKTTAADAFFLAETAIEETEEALRKSKEALAQCRLDVQEAIKIAEKSAYLANVASQKATVLAARAAISASEKVDAKQDMVAGAGVGAVVEETEASAATEASEDIQIADVKDEEAKIEAHVNVPVESNVNVVDETVIQEVAVEVEEEVEEITLEDDISSLEYDDVDYHLSEMTPPFLGEDQCLVPGEAVVRVEKAKDNSRRIFAGIDIMASVDDVWNVLTDYDNLQRVVPNLVVNKVVERYDGESEPSNISYDIDSSISSEDQCKSLSKQMKGSKLSQVGGAKVVGINFSAKVNLEVREWPNGLPDFFHFNDDVYDGISRAERAKLERERRLVRYHFPRPFAISKLPTRDISMQSVENDDGEFRLYQGVWRMQPLVGCTPAGKDAMRLTYAVELSPRPYLPVALVEGRISKDLCNNLLAIRDFVKKE